MTSGYVRTPTPLRADGLVAVQVLSSIFPDMVDVLAESIRIRMYAHRPIRREVFEIRIRWTSKAHVVITRLRVSSLVPDDEAYQATHIPFASVNSEIVVRTALDVCARAQAFIEKLEKENDQSV